VGLALAGFLVVIGLTGSVTVFFPELDPWLNADLIYVKPQGQALDPLEVLSKVQAADPRAHIYGIHFPKSPEHAMSGYAEGVIDPTSGVMRRVDYDQFYVNQYTGEVIGTREWGALPFERKNVFTFVYFLHYALVLPEFLGEVFMGVVALIWACDCIVGFLLTLPRRARASKKDMGFLARWKPSWLIKTRVGTNRFVFDSHRAVGLWLWLVLCMFAVSGFSFNLPTVYSAVLNKVTHYSDADVHAELPKPLTSPPITWREAKILSEKYMAEQAAANSFEIVRPYSLTYRREKGIYVYKVISSRDLTIYGETSVSLDATTGKLITVEVPTGHRAANTFTAWIKALHQATVFGFVYRAFASLVGLLTAGLAITGFLIWFRKSRARQRVRGKSAHLSADVAPAGQRT